MKYHVRVFILDQKGGDTSGQYISPPVQQRGGGTKGVG